MTYGELAAKILAMPVEERAKQAVLWNAGSNAYYSLDEDAVWTDSTGFDSLPEVTTVITFYEDDRLGEP